MWHETDVENYPPEPKTIKMNNPNVHKKIPSRAAQRLLTENSMTNQFDAVTECSTKNTSESEAGDGYILEEPSTFPTATDDDKVKSKRTNLLKIDFGGKKKKLSNISNEIVQVQKGANEIDLTVDDVYQSELQMEDKRHSFDWKIRSKTTDLLSVHFTLIERQIEPCGIKSSGIKSSFKYKCKICEKNGIDLVSRTKGVVTCPYGNNSNMKRHISTVSNQ